jgi:hypothetical protein
VAWSVTCAADGRDRLAPFSPLIVVRAHGDQLRLARNSLSDGSPDH